MTDTHRPQVPDPALAEGIALFNRGEYYACHDALEAIWMEAPSAEKPFYQGILQIAVGLYHLGNHNWRGAMTLLGEGVNRLRAFEPDYEGVDVAKLVDCGWAWLMALNAVGADQIATPGGNRQPIPGQSANRRKRPSTKRGTSNRAWGHG